MKKTLDIKCINDSNWILLNTKLSPTFVLESTLGGRGWLYQVHLNLLMQNYSSTFQVSSCILCRKVRKVSETYCSISELSPVSVLHYTQMTSYSTM